jgi:hypothetical protein
MSIKGQTHAKRAREFALKEKRERKKAKKDARLAGDAAEATDDATGEPILQPQPEPEAEWVQ